MGPEAHNHMLSQRRASRPAGEPSAKLPAAELSQYEQQRAQNMSANHDMLKALGLVKEEQPAKRASSKSSTLTPLT